MKKILLTAPFIAFLQMVGFSQNEATKIFASTPKTQKPSLSNFGKKFVIVGMGYEFGMPMGNMKNGMSPTHSMSLLGALPISFVSPNLQLGIEMVYGLYGSKSFGINYRQNGNYINTTVNYTSSIAQAGVNASYLFFSKQKIQPYITSKMGYLELSSSLRINDPKDPDACRALESKTIETDGSFYWAYGLGFRFIVGKNNLDNRSFVDFSVTKTRGNAINYVNINDLHDHHSPTQLQDGVQPINVNFVNASTQNIHQHRIAELYNNPINLLQFKLSYVAYLRLKKG